MNSNSNLSKLAKLLVNYSINVKENETVSINGSTATETLLQELYKEILIAGGHPRVHIDFQDKSYLFYKHYIRY